MNAKLSIDQLELTAEGTLPRPATRRRVADTSRAARARSTRTVELRELILNTIGECMRNPIMRGATAEEIHERTSATATERADFHRGMEIRRRLSDLHTKLHKIRDTGIRRVNASGNPMIVWEVGDARG